MITRSVKRKILKISAYILGSIAVLLTTFHFWFVNHAEQLLEELVESRSNGKLKLHVKKFKFNWFSDNMQLRNAVFYSTDTSTATTGYRFTVERINIRIKDIRPLIFEKKILIDSLGLVNSDIQITTLRQKDIDSTKNRDISLALEMGKVYKSIQDALEVLQVSRFQVDNGKVTLINKTKPDQLPVTITNISLHLDNLQVDTGNTTGKRKILFSDNVTLNTHDQDIIFPDGRHRLSFGNFRINILKKIVEFDSCTISATKGDSTKSSFRVFFDKLLLTNIDFDTLYQKEVIKADSVYCINPQFKLDIELEKRTGKKRPPPRLDELIQLLTGDVQLAYVVVNNGSFDISTIRDGRPSSFTSDHNNFELQGLRIEKNAPRHVSAKSFAMAIRNYENFLRDSTYNMQFDSILFINNSVYLSNFSVRQMQDGDVINSLSMPQFELKGLLWDDLIYDQNLIAERATLHRPVINYFDSKNKKTKNKKEDIFKTLAVIGEIIQLNNLDINNGQINMHFRGGAELRLENASVSILGRDLVQSGRMTSLQRSVKELRFRKGSFKTGGLVAKLENVDFIGEDGRLSAGTLNITNNKKALVINAKKVTINKMVIDNSTYIPQINGIQWQEADIQIRNSTVAKKNVAPGFILKNIQGANTKVITSLGKQNLSVFLESISADEFLLQKNNKPVITNLHSNGKNLSLIGNNQQLSIEHFSVADHQNSIVQNFILKNRSEEESVSVTIPSLSFSPDINLIINGKIAADNVNVTQPVINLRKLQVKSSANDKEKKLPEIVFNKITIQQPEFYLQQPEEKTLTKVEWRGKLKNNSLELTDFKISDQSGVSVNTIGFSLNNFSFTSGGKNFTTGSGEIKTAINNFSMLPSGTGEWDWKGTIIDLYAKGFSFDSLGKKKGKLTISSARLNNLALSSTSGTDLRKLVKENLGLQIKEITGQYADTDNSFGWSNASYNNSSKKLSVDSFIFRPVPGKESFIANHKFQADYINLQTGAVRVDKFDLYRYLNDTILGAGSMKIDNVYMTVFRDKRVPFDQGIIKPLPTILFSKIPTPFSIDTIRVNDAHIEYTELNEKTNKTGTITFNRLNAAIYPVTNLGKRQSDSLSLHAQAYMMDAVKIKLHLKESYIDPQAGFLMTATASPVDPKILNSILIPLASLKIESGFLDTLSMQATGTEYFATGETKMIYHDLKIKLPDNKTGKTKKFASFLANTFIIKNNNRSRTGTIFFERIRDRSFFNYLVKIAVSGISSSIGLKNNNKQLRKHKKEASKRNLSLSKND